LTELSITGPSVGAAKQDLIHANVASAEGSRRTGHIQKPDAIRDLRHMPQDCIGVLPQPLDPAAQGEFIVFPKVLNIPHLQTPRFRSLKRLAKGHELAIGKHIPIDERIFSGWRRIRACNAVIEKDTARFQNTLHNLEILRQVFQADVLEHADAGNLVDNLSIF
jgi:hypothetical protein